MLLQTNPASGAAPPPSDDLDLAKAKRALEGGLSVDAAKQKLGALADSAAETASDFAATTTEKLGSRHQTMQNTGLSMGVKDTGSSLATLARALANDGVRSDFHDMRKDEKIPLKSRIKGAKVSRILRCVSTWSMLFIARVLLNKVDMRISGLLHFVGAFCKNKGAEYGWVVIA